MPQVIFHVQCPQSQINQAHKKQDTMSQDLQKEKTTETELQIHEILELTESLKQIP